MRFRFTSFTVAAAAIIPSIGIAQTRPPIRQLGAVVAKSADSLPSLGGIRALSNGSVLVNDISGRKLVLYDAMLTNPVLVADSTPATSTAYAGRTGGLIPYRADSSIFVDPSSMSMLIIDGSGKIAKVMSVPRTQDVQMLAGPLSTSVGYDPRGRLVYRAPPQFRFGGGPGGPGAGGAPRLPDFPDSLPIIRVDLATRQVDTIAYGKIPKVKLEVQQTDNGFRASSIVNPLPTVDDFVMLPDGTVALVRGTDYHVDFYNTDGTKVSAPKIPFDWQRLTDDDKVALIDSVKAARARVLAANPNAVGGGGGAPQVQVVGGPGGGGGAAGRRPGGADSGARRGGAGAGGGGFQLNFVQPSELPDYKPAFFAGSSRADADGNIWIRTIPTKKIEGGPVYDVVNKKGELVDRVQVPVNTSIAGFGSDGSVYLNLQSGSSVFLEKAKLR